MVAQQEFARNARGITGQRRVLRLLLAAQLTLFVARNPARPSLLAASALCNQRPHTHFGGFFTEKKKSFAQILFGNFRKKYFENFIWKKLKK